MKPRAPQDNKSKTFFSRLRSIPYLAELTPSHLSGQLLVLTVAFVMIAEIAIYVPSIANFRRTWLVSELEDAQIASLAVEATNAGILPAKVEMELLENAGVMFVALRRDSARILMLSEPEVPMADHIYDLRRATPVNLIWDALVTLFIEGDRYLVIRGTPFVDAGELIEIMIEERLLKTAMINYSRNILLLSIIISVISAILVFITLNYRFVEPMKSITENMVRFRENPEDATRIITPKSKIVEMAIAERELRDLQSQVRTALHEKKRLAELGTAVSKINHDLRNILASAQLLSDMLTTSDDPKVQRLAPKLISSVDRAIDLAKRTLRHGKAEEAAPSPISNDVKELLDDVIDNLALDGGSSISWDMKNLAAVNVWADPEHLFRILMNVLRNAAQALADDHTGPKIVRIETSIHENDFVAIDIHDTGPGIPNAIEEHLFEAFAAGNRTDSIGLGLAIAKELAELNNGSIELVSSSEAGTHFRILLPSKGG